MKNSTERLTVERSFADPLVVDPVTGLPALGKHHAWMVWNTDDVLYIQLMYRIILQRNWLERLFNWEPVTKWEEYSSHEYYRQVNENTEQGLLDAATKIYTSIQEKSVKSANARKFVGMYPPNSIL